MQQSDTILAPEGLPIFSDHSQRLLDILLDEDSPLPSRADLVEHVQELIHIRQRMEQEQTILSDELAKQQNLLQIFVDYTPAAVAMFDTELRYLAASQQWAEDYGVDPQNIIGRSHYDVFPEIGADWKSLHQQCLAGEVLHRDADPFPRADGSIDYVTWEIRPWYEKDDQIGGIIMFTQVVTDFVLTQQALVMHEQKYRLLVQNLPDTAVLLFDQDMRYTLADGPLLEKIGYRPSEIVNKTIDEVMPPEESKPIKALYQRVLAGESLEHQRHTELETGEEVVSRGQFVPVVDPFTDTPHGLVVIQDITKQYQADQKLNKSVAQLTEANQEIQRFAYIMSHDLRAPLINLKGFAALLLDNLEALRGLEPSILPALDGQQQEEWKNLVEDEIPEAVTYINVSADRMDKFTRAILKLSRLGRRELSLQRVQTSEVVEQILQSLTTQIRAKNIEVQVTNLLPVQADPLTVDQVFTNIITNAINYLDAERTGIIQISSEASEDFVTFHIQDNGRGIAERDFSKVFEPFRRAGKHSVSGEGMGLAYTRALLRRHQGDIWFKSELGVGTTFSFVLPKKGN